MPNGKESQAQELRRIACEIAMEWGGTVAMGDLYGEVIARLKLKSSRVRKDFFLTSLMGGPRSSMEFRVEGETVTLINYAGASSSPTVEEFVYLGIETLPWSVYMGAIHTVYSGFNKAFRAYFPNLDPIAETKKMIEAGKLFMRPIHGGVLISREPMKKALDADGVLKIMGV